MNLILDVVRLTNEDVIATSLSVTDCEDAAGFIAYNQVGGNWQLFSNDAHVDNVSVFDGNTTGLNTDYMYHVDANGEIVGLCEHELPYQAHGDHNRSGAIG